VKLVDYQQHLSALENNNNPLATVVMAHLAALNTQSNRNERKVQKLALVRRLYEQGLEQQDILNLLVFVDWMLTLPPNLEEQFKLEVEQLEAERTMKYVTSFERSGIRSGIVSGIEIGKQQEALLFVTRLLNRRLGNIDEVLLEQVSSLSVEKLEALGEALLDFNSVSDLTNWLSSV